MGTLKSKLGSVAKNAANQTQTEKPIFKKQEKEKRGPRKIGCVVVPWKRNKGR